MKTYEIKFSKHELFWTAQAFGRAAMSIHSINPTYLNPNEIKLGQWWTEMAKALTKIAEEMED